MDIGEKIKEIRKELGYTLQEFADLCGLSVSLISQVERNLASPSIQSLVKMAEVLQTPVGSFFENGDKEKDQIIVKKSERRTLSLPNHTTGYELLTPGELDGNIRVLFITLEPNQFSSTQKFGHSGKEICVAFQGSIRVEFENHEYVLDEGDSIAFNSEKSHRFYNPTKTQTKLFLVLHK